MDLHFFAVGPHSPGCSSTVYLISGSEVASTAAPTNQAVVPFCQPLSPGAPAAGPDDDAAWTFSYTDSQGSPRHGFCRRVLPLEGTEEGAPEAVLCLLAPQPYFQVFFRALDILEHLLATEQLLSSIETKALPGGSAALTFLKSLRAALPADPASCDGSVQPGDVIRVALPQRDDYPLTQLPRIATDVAPGGRAAPPLPPLAWGPDFTEVQIPPEVVPAAGDPAAPTVPLATLVVKLHPAVLSAMLASLLLERRVVLVATSFLTVAIAAHGAAAMLRPLRWHNIFFPLLPRALLDVLGAPTPFLVGLPSHLKPSVDWASLDSIVVDLDLGTVEPSIDSPASDYHALPGADALTSAFAAMRGNIRSSNDFRANGSIAAIMQEFLAATIGGYREHVRSPSQPPPRALSDRLATGFTSFKTRFVDGRSSGGSVPFASDDTGSSSQAQAQAVPDDIILGDNGFKFYHSSFVSSFSGRIGRDFAASLLHTQLWQVFIRERMAMMQQPYLSNDVFEMRVLNRQARKHSVAGTLANTVQRVRGSSRGQAFANWTGKNTQGLVAFGKKFGNNMMSALTRFEDRAAQFADGGTGTVYNEQAPGQFFDNIDIDAASEASGHEAATALSSPPPAAAATVATGDVVLANVEAAQSGSMPGPTEADEPNLAASTPEGGIDAADRASRSSVCTEDALAGQPMASEASVAHPDPAGTSEIIAPVAGCPQVARESGGATPEDVPAEPHTSEVQGVQYEEQSHPLVEDSSCTKQCP